MKTHYYLAFHYFDRDLSFNCGVPIFVNTSKEYLLKKVLFNK